jgi:hypothetical protein
MVKFLPGCVVDKGKFQQSTKDKGLANLETKKKWNFPSNFMFWPIMHFIISILKSFDEMSFENISFDETSFENIPFDKLSFDQLSFNEMSFD